MYDWDDREEFLNQFLDDFYEELGTVADGVYPGVPIWTELGGHERGIVRDAAPELTETTEQYADAMLDAIRPQVYITQQRDQIDDYLDRWVSEHDGENRIIYIHMTLADGRHETSLKNYVDRYADEIAAAEDAEDLDQRLRDTDERHWTCLLPYRRSDWAEGVWKAVQEGDPSTQEVLQETRKEREAVDMYTARLLDKVESLRETSPFDTLDDEQDYSQTDEPFYAS